MLSPLPMMTTYGAGGLRANLLTGLVLSLNGNAVTVSSRLWSELAVPAEPGPPDALAMSRRLKTLLTDARGTPPLTFATVHLFSMHTIQLRMWLKAGGIDPDQDVKIIVLPPEQMCDSLARGIIDGYCVGEPWNTLAVQHGIGAVIATGYRIWNNAPEKVLLPSLSGEMTFSKNQPVVSVPDFHVFSRYLAGFLWRSAAAAMVRQCSFALGKGIGADEISSLGQQCYRPDLYREAARLLGMPKPSRDVRSEGGHDRSWMPDPGIVLGPDRTLLPL